MNLQILSGMQETLIFAAWELKDYLEKINPEIVISIQREGNGKKREYISEIADGNVAASLLRLMVEPALAHEKGKDPAIDDIYEIRIKNLSGHIKGSNPRAVLIGVYQYLYHLGCRFLRPGRKYERLPSLSRSDEFDAFLKHAASFRHRGVCIEGADSLENICDFLDWLPKLGFNSFFLQFQNPGGFLKRWYKHENNPLYNVGNEGANDITSEEVMQMSDQIDQELGKRGLLHHRVGHGWTGETLGHTAYGWEGAGAELKEEYALFPALLKGKRELHNGIPTNTNLCYTNPLVIRRFAACVTEYAQAHPEVDYLHVWLADDFNNHCECGACAKHTPADLYVNLLNKIDESLSEKGLNTKIVCLLYVDLLWPPVRERIEDPSRFLLMFAPISRSFTHSYKDMGALQEIPQYIRNRIKLPNTTEENTAFLKAWQKCYQGEAFVYDYHLGRAHYGDLGYVNISKILYDDIHTLKKLGLSGHISCQELRAFLPNALPNYVMGRALLCEDLRFEDIAEDYCKSAYGDGWEECLTYLADLSNLCSCDYFNGKGLRKNETIVMQMKQAIGLLEEKDDFLQSHMKKKRGVEREFWEHLCYHEKYARLMAEALSILASGNSADLEEKWMSFKTFIRKNEKEFQECLDVYRIIDIGTNYTGFHMDKAGSSM